MSKNPKKLWKQLILKSKNFISSEQLEKFQLNFLENLDIRYYLSHTKSKVKSIL